MARTKCGGNAQSVKLRGGNVRGKMGCPFDSGLGPKLLLRVSALLPSLLLMHGLRTETKFE